MIGFTIHSTTMISTGFSARETTGSAILTTASDKSEVARRPRRGASVSSADAPQGTIPRTRSAAAATARRASRERASRVRIMVFSGPAPDGGLHHGSRVVTEIGSRFHCSFQETSEFATRFGDRKQRMREEKSVHRLYGRRSLIIVPRPQYWERAPLY